MRKILILLTILSIPFALNAKENSDLESVLDQIQNKYESIDDFHSKFIQEATVRALDKIQKADGEVWFKKPGKMRWNYIRPNKDEIVSDGKTFWIYNQEENQVLESSLDEVMDKPTTTTLLSGLGELKKLFRGQFSNTNTFNENNSYIIDLFPKHDTEEYNKFTIAVDKNTSIVKTIYLFDPFGNLTKIRLIDIEINKGIPDKLFKFEIPKGTEVTRVPSSLNQ